MKMTDLRKAAEMALEALKLWGNAGEAPKWYGRHERIDAINALRQALAQPEWVGLSKDEMFELFEKYDGMPFSLMLAVHDKLKEKNT